MDSYFNSSGIDDGVAWLNTAMTHPPMPQDANLVGAKELFAKELTRINETFSHLV
jgi:enoyl reductase-like protein